MTKYRVTTNTEEIIINAESSEQLKVKVDFIKTFAVVVNVSKIIEC